MLKALVILAHAAYPPACCSGQDCHPVAETDVIEQVPGGWTFNGLAVPQAIVKPSFDGQFHVCQAGGVRSNPVICFFVPTNV